MDKWDRIFVVGTASILIACMGVFCLITCSYIDLHNESVNGQFKKLSERIEAVERIPVIDAEIQALRAEVEAHREGAAALTAEVAETGGLLEACAEKSD